ncbi:hypothetical protein BHE74_00052331 [Ensete ventricosum]|nr:hypothetical protein BHE74_00052331 [Ensete ventricosum]
MRIPLEPDVIFSYSTNSVREQLRQVNQRLDEVQRDFVRSKEEVGETTKGGSSFAPEILDKPIPSSFRLPTLEPYNGSTDPSKHVTVFRAQMALYDTSNALMPPSTMPEMLQRANQYIAAETLVVGKREDHKKSQGDKPQGKPPGHPEEETGRNYLLLGPFRSRSTQPELWFFSKSVTKDSSGLRTRSGQRLEAVTKEGTVAFIETTVTTPRNATTSRTRSRT